MGLMGCEEAEQSHGLTYVVNKSIQSIEVPAKGELVAKTSTPISIPAGIFEPQQLAWMVDENQLVKKDEVIARLDATKYRYELQQKGLERKQVVIEKDVKKNTLSNEEDDIGSDKKLIKKELTIADKYVIDDVRLYSKNDIIDKMKNKDYLEARLANNEWRFDKYQMKADTEMELLALRQKEFDTKMMMYNSSLDKMEIKAPHDGVFVLSKNWRGEKTKVGEMLFPGREFAVLPDLSEMQAELYILESESANVKVGLAVKVFLDAYPNEMYRGMIASIEPMAQVISRESPVKYFKARVDLEQTVQEKMRPGTQLNARILLTEDSSDPLIPSTALYQKDEKFYVDVLEKGQWKQREIEMGVRGSDLTQVTEGLVEKDVVAIFPLIKEFSR